jgi:hypothetical protein
MANALLKSSLIASAAFAAAWFRGSSTAVLIVRYFAFYGALIAVLSMVVGIPLARLIERLRIGRSQPRFHRYRVRSGIDASGRP